MTQHVAAALFDVAGRMPDAPALGRRTSSGEWISQSFGELAGAVRRLASALVAERLLPAETAVIIAPTGPDWFLAHFAVLAAGGVVVPVDETSSLEETYSIIRETEARVALVAGERARATLERLRPRLPSLRAVIVLDDATGNDPTVVSLRRIDELPYDVATTAEIRRREKTWSGDDVAAVHYMPSPVGRMRGAVVSHENTLYPLRAISDAFELPSEQSIVMTLPITQSVPYWACLAVLLNGGTVWTAGPDADLGAALRELRPSVVVATGTILENLLDQVREDVRTRLAISPDLVEWALRTAVEAEACATAGRRVPPALALQRRAAEIRVFAPMRARLGGPRPLTLISGMSMPGPELMHWLTLLDQTPLVGWGSRETSALATVNRPGAARAGSAGLPLPGTEIRVDETGEVLVRGPGVMRGYYGRPAETRAALVDGWLHSGQSGRLDEDGYLYLTSRVDDIILTSTLQYTSPRPLERALEDDSLVAEAVVIGDARPCLTVLVHPDLAALRALLADDAPERDEDLVRDARAVRAVGDVVRRLNETTTDVSALRAFQLLAAPLGPATATTGSAMTRRQRAQQDHAGIIDAMYARLEASRKPSRGA